MREGERSDVAEVLEPDFSAVLNSLPVGILVVHINGTVQYSNGVTEQIFQACEQTFQHGNLSDIFTSPCVCLELMRRSIEGGGPVRDYNISTPTLVTFNKILVDVCATPLPKTKNTVVLTVQESDVNNGLGDGAVHLSTSNSYVGATSMLAHEIKNPLSGIKGAAQLLGKNASLEDQELVQLITDETDRIVKLVDRMEVFSNDSLLNREPVNLNILLRSIKKLSANGFAQGVQFVEKFDPCLPDAAGSHDELFQAFLNLVKNAAEALGNSADGQITLTTALSPDKTKNNDHVSQNSLPLEITVSDNADGIAEDFQAVIFDPMVTTKSAGSGLGLPVVARIVERHGGQIRCLSCTEGTEIKVLLPVWQAGTNG